MISDNNKLTHTATEQIERLLTPDFPETEAYRYNSASIRIRIIDEQFKGKSLVEREELVLPLIHKLAPQIQEDITVLLLLAPEETSASLMNAEFEEPTPSGL